MHYFMIPTLKNLKTVVYVQEGRNPNKNTNLNLYENEYQKH